MLIVDPLMPQAAVVDPLLTLTMPAGSRLTAVDALTHAIESCVRAEPAADNALPGGPFV